MTEGSRIVALGHYQPTRVLTNDERVGMARSAQVLSPNQKPKRRSAQR